MSNAPARAKQERECDECSRKQVEIARVYRGHRYCRTCYAREFKHRACPGCGNTARLPREFPKAVCRRCERDRPCVRCGREMARMGLRTPYGPACPACAPYFREEEPCEACGTPSRRLTRVARLGHDLRLCPRCARVDHETCAWCKRPRLLAENENGEWLCNRCRKEGKVPCPSCGEPMPAGRGSQCQTCYSDELADKRIALDCAAFSSETMAQHFGAFGRWLKETRGTEKAAQKIHRFLPFFIEIERAWGNIPGYGALLKHFGARRLRAVLLAVRWMEVVGLVEPDATAREADSDHRRIDATLARFPTGSWAREILENYRKVLEERVETGRSSTRSVRLALAPAAGLLETAVDESGAVPSQKALERYLRRTPGQRAAVSGFVAHLRDAHGARLAMPRRDPRAVSRRRHRLLREALLELMRRRESGPEARHRWIATALEYFHDVPKTVVATATVENATPDQDGLSVQIGETRYWIPLRSDDRQAA